MEQNKKIEGRLNIAFYRHSIYNRGGDRIILQYANYLADCGHNVCFYVRKINTIFSISRKIYINPLPYPGKIGTLLYSALHNLNHDVVIADIVHLSSLLSLRNRVLYFAQADDLEYYGNPLARKCVDFLYRRYLSLEKPVITVSEKLSKIFFSRYGFKKSYIVPNGIDLDSFYPDPDPTLMQVKGGKRAIFFMVRGDHYRKGHDVAVQVFQALDTELCEKIELWTCGDRFTGKYAFTIRQFGAVDDSSLRRILSSVDIFFYPSRHEGFGLFPLEAMACGSVVVTTDAIPYARETECILTSSVGDIRDLTKNLKQLIVNEEKYRHLKNLVVAEAKKYDLKESKRAFETAVRRILEVQR